MKDPIYPNYITRRKGWRIYGAYSIKDIPYKAVKSNRRDIYAESIKDIFEDIDKLEG